MLGGPEIEKLAGQCILSGGHWGLGGKVGLSRKEINEKKIINNKIIQNLN